MRDFRDNSYPAKPFANTLSKQCRTCLQTKDHQRLYARENTHTKWKIEKERTQKMKILSKKEKHKKITIYA